MYQRANRHLIAERKIQIVRWLVLGLLRNSEDIQKNRQFLCCEMYAVLSLSTFSISTCKYLLLSSKKENIAFFTERVDAFVHSRYRIQVRFCNSVEVTVGYEKLIWSIFLQNEDNRCNTFQLYRLDCFLEHYFFIPHFFEFSSLWSSVVWSQKQVVHFSR